jgi:hypothetical protein
LWEIAVFCLLGRVHAKEYEFGWNRGNPNHFISRYEQNKEHKFRTRVIWGFATFSKKRQSRRKKGERRERRERREKEERERGERKRREKEERERGERKRREKQERDEKEETED